MPDRDHPLRIAAAITPHGFGHAAVTLAVLDALHGLWPGGVDVTFLTRVPEPVVRQRWGRPCTVVAHAAATDFGMLMKSSTTVRVADSIDAYAAAHAKWEAVVEADAKVIAAAQPDLMLTCISYAALAAARRLGIPGVGVGPFTWKEILGAYANGAPEAVPALGKMAEAYAGADALIATTPAVAMDYPTLRSVGPVGRPGRQRRTELRAALSLQEGERVALVALGGIVEDLPVDRWPPVTGWRYLDSVAVESTGLSVSDAIASCDAVITKPGYGTFVEAACAGTAILYRDRPDWPETVGMAAWAARHVPCLRVDPGTFDAGALANHLPMVSEAPPQPLAVPEGNRQAAEIVVEVICGRAP